MKIVYKHILKNVFSKPFRTLLLVFCIMVCAFVAELSMDITGNLELMLKAMVMQMMGTSDMVVSDEIGITEEYSLSDDNDQLLIFEGNAGIVTDMKGEYAYYQKKEYEVDYFDYKKAYEMRMMGEEINLADDETYITSYMAKKLNLKEGEMITLIDPKENEHSYKITKILPAFGLANGRKTAFLSEKSFREIYGDVKAYQTYIHVKDPEAIRNVKKEIEEERLGTKATIFVDSDENKEEMKTIRMLLLLIFSICLFLVIFVTMSVSKRIINERMSVVGTLRSLGMTSGFTTRLLILENAIYGLIGAGVGAGIYMLIRYPLLNAILSPQASEGLEVHMDVPPASITNILLVLLIGVLIECACPIKEIFSANKMSIRDIIFDNKDTAFRMSRTGRLIGFVTFIIALVTYFTADKMEGLFVCFVCCIIAVSQLFPYLLKLCSAMFAKIFSKWDKPIAQMASRECYARKSTVGSAVLCVTAATISIIMFVLLSSMNAMYDIHTYDSDLIAEVNYKTESAPFGYVKDLDGVSDTEEIAIRTDSVMFGEKKVEDISILKMNEGGYHLFAAIKNAPDHVETDEFYIDEIMGNRYNIAVGDVVNITLDCDGFLPREKKLKCAGYVDSFELDTTCETIILSEKVYEEIYQKYINYYLVKCDNPEEIKEELNTYSGSYLSEVKSKDEYYSDWQKRKNGMKRMFLLIIILGVGITVIGMISNQLIGFEGRKRECAVLISTSMTREKCSKMLFLESVIASGVSLITAFFVACIVLVPLNKLMTVMGMVVPLEYHASQYVLFLAILWVVFSLIAVFPIRALYKMNLAMQLKYE